MKKKVLKQKPKNKGINKTKEKKSVKLYNMDRQEWRGGDFGPGASWRSDTLHKCEICHAKTNRWIMPNNIYCMAPKIYCPAEDEKGHDRLESTLTQYDELNYKIREYNKILKTARKINAIRAKVMITGLCVQRELLKEKIKVLREKFSGKFDDVEGLGSNAKIEQFGHYARYGEKDIFGD